MPSGFSNMLDKLLQWTNKPPRSNDFLKFSFSESFVQVCTLQAWTQVWGVWIHLLLLSRILHYGTESPDELWGRKSYVWSDRQCHFEIMIKNCGIWYSFGCTLLDFFFYFNKKVSFLLLSTILVNLICYNFLSFLESNYLYCYFSYKNNTIKFFQSRWVINTLRLFLFYEKCGWGLKGS